jgi:hypothetical protein
MDNHSTAPVVYRIPGPLIRVTCRTFMLILCGNQARQEQ